MEIPLIALCGGIFIFAVFYLILPSNKKDGMDKRFRRYFKNEDISEVQDQVLKEKRSRLRRKKSQKLLHANKEFTNYLLMSGVKLSVTEFLTAWSMTTFIPMLIVLIIRGSVITTVALGFIGFVLPPFLVKRSRKKRQEEFNKQLGESLTVMVNCIKAGFTFQQAMESIASDMQPPISTEFDKTLREVRYGISFEDALKHMVERVKNQDLDLLVSAVLTSAQVGGNLSDILEVIAETVRDRIKIKAEVRVLTSSGRTSGFIVGLLPVFIILLLMVINPEYMSSFFASNIGRIMMIISVVLEITGFLLIRKIVNVKY